MNVKNLVTFGYAEKEEISKREFEQACFEWKKWEKEAKAYDEAKEQLNKAINKIIVVCKDKNFQQKADVVSESYSRLLQSNTSILVKNVPAGQSVAAGAAAGVAGAIGTFTLVGTFGVASTGVAISSLAGAAATSATLAALGGGSLAAGGAGILGGVCVLGGVVAAIAVPGAMTFNSYSMNRKYEQTTAEIKKTLEKAPAVEAIQKQKEKMLLLNEKLEERYCDFNQGNITAEELYDSSKKMIDEKAGE